MTQSNSLTSDGSTYFVRAQAMAYRALEDSLSSDERTQSAKEAITLLESALAKGVDKEKEIIAHAQIASMLLHPNSSEVFEKIGKIGIEALPKATRALQEYDKSLDLDTKVGVLVFKDPVQRAAHFPQIENLWLAQTYYLSDTFPDSVQAYSFLKDKMKKLEYLKGSYLPKACYQVGYLAQNQNIAGVSPADWLRKCIEAEDYGPDSQLYEMYQETKTLAKKNLPQAKEGKCFLASAVYGSPYALQVIGFGTFRDTLLLRSSIGRTFISTYYLFSPKLAKPIARNRTVRFLLRTFLFDPLYYFSNLVLHLNSLVSNTSTKNHQTEVSLMAKIKVKCPEGHEFYMEDYERKACPKCGRVIVGPQAK